LCRYYVANSHRLVRKTWETQSSLQECLINCVSQTAKKQSNPPSAPFPTAAQSDYIQNGLVLPRDPKNLELLLRDVDAKGFLDIELVWKLRQKEGLKNVRGQIRRKLKQNKSAYTFEESVLNVLAEAL
jgi:hypothetical protein